jgi:DNA-binding transcriptional LysR family regulator
LTPRQVVECEESAALISLVRAGVGLSLLREELALAAAEHGEVVIWPHVRLSAQLGMIYARDMEHDPAIVAMLSVLRSVWGLPR